MVNSGQKRKLDEEGDLEKKTQTQTHGSTLFVSNLPYTATSTDLSTAFSDMAPVRSAFVVLDKETKVSKGVGYVSFAMKEDVEQVFENVTNNGLNLDNRILRVQWPSQKDSVHRESPNKRPRIQNPKTPADPLAIRTILISGLPPSVDSKVLWKKVRKCEGAEKVDWPAEGGDKSKAHVLFSDLKWAQEAISRLHNHVYKGAKLSVILKKRLDGLIKVKTNAPSRNSRLIVRNLPWNIDEQQLRTLFLPHGPVHSIVIPKETKPEDANAPPRSKGFAFVWMLSRTDAERAIASVNGSVVGEDANNKGKGASKEGRTIAVDWALSKDRWEAEKAKLDDSMAVDEDPDVKDESMYSDEQSLSASDAEDDDSASEDLSAMSSGEEDVDEARSKPQLPPTETGTTLFIRNIPFEATEDELRTTFRYFGPLRYARITLEPESGRSRGTGFACYWNREDADKAIQHAQLLKSETGLQEEQRNPFKLPSMLTPDPSSSLAHSLVMHGRTLDVARAVTREEATKLKEQGEKEREKADKRNIYLMREGVIFPNSPAAATIPSAELEKRTQSFNTRRALLTSNPSLYISRTRLSIRRIPTFATDRTLKRLGIHAARTFEEEVKSGTRAALTEDELTTPSEAANGEAMPDRKHKKGVRETAVRQAKLVRDAERADVLSVGNKGKSKGYGFLEMLTHADALRVLRWANNNPNVPGLLRDWWRDELEAHVQSPPNGTDAAQIKRWKEKIAELKDQGDRKDRGTLMIEFAIENVQVVKRRSQKAAMSKEVVVERKSVFKGGRRIKVDDVKSARFSSPKSPRETTDKIGQQESRPVKATERSLGSIIGRKRKQRKTKRG